jgi:hypothetical protein
MAEPPPIICNITYDAEAFAAVAQGIVDCMIQGPQKACWEEFLRECCPCICPSAASSVTSFIPISGQAFLAREATGLCTAANGTYQENGTYNGKTAYQNENGWWLFFSATGPWTDTWVLASDSDYPSLAGYKADVTGGDTPPTSANWNPQFSCSGVVTVTSVGALFFTDLASDPLLKSDSVGSAAPLVPIAPKVKTIKTKKLLRALKRRKR